MLLDNYSKVKGITLDITPRCTLFCSKCERQMDTWTGMKPLLSDMPINDFIKVINYFHDIRFSGPYGDAILHKEFLTMLEETRIRGNEVRVNNSASHRSLNWYKKAFLANPNAFWVFGIDGLPEESHKYRVNQDGKHLFNAMELANEMGVKVRWQYLVFKYNQHNIEKARKIALDHNIDIEVLKSKRFDGPNDPLKPDDHYSNNFWLKDDNKNLTKEQLLEKYVESGLYPKCLHPKAMFGHTSQGYIMPCCWLTAKNVEKYYPDLCNESTKLSNVKSIEEILESPGWKKHLNLIKTESRDAPFKCWRKCTNGAPLSKTTVE